MHTYCACVPKYVFFRVKVVSENGKPKSKEYLMRNLDIFHNQETKKKNIFISPVENINY